MEKKQEKSVCEESTFQLVYETHITAVRNFVYYKIGDLDKAEDIAQDAFIKMWQNCKTVIFEKALGFALTVANRLFLNVVRHQKVKLNFEKRPHTDRDHQSPEFIAQEQEFKEALENAIATLPEKQREVFLMSRIDKMSYREIAESLDISVKAVEKRMNSCLKNLKDKVKELNVYKI
ncbi:MAG: RNA polymerase sigma factor [Flammeovirgaceae bacterium]